MKKVYYNVRLERTDGKIFFWILSGSLKKVKEVVQDYADSCPYESQWNIYGNGKDIYGSTIGRDN